jgi:hypothetical protein
MLLFMSSDASISYQPPAVSSEVPSLRGRDYVSFRADQLLQENKRLNLPSLGGFVQSFVDLEADADRESQLWGGRAGRYSGLYVLLGLPAAVLAAVAGVTVLASTAGRLAAGIIALMSAALSASATFLDSAKKRDQAEKLSTEWEDLYNEMRVCRLTQLASFTTVSGPPRLTSFSARAAAIRAGRDQAAVQRNMASAGGQDSTPLYYRVPNIEGWPLSRAQDKMSSLSLELEVSHIDDRGDQRTDTSDRPSLLTTEPYVVDQAIRPGTPVPEGTIVPVMVRSVVPPQSD